MLRAYSTKNQPVPALSVSVRDCVLHMLVSCHIQSEMFLFTSSNIIGSFLHSAMNPALQDLICSSNPFSQVCANDETVTFKSIHRAKLYKMGTNTSSPAAYVDHSTDMSGIARMSGAQPRNKPAHKTSAVTCPSQQSHNPGQVSTLYLHISPSSPSRQATSSAGQL